MMLRVFVRFLGVCVCFALVTGSCLPPGQQGDLTTAGAEAMRVGDFSRALTCYKEASLENPSHPLILTNIGTCYHALGMIPEAEQTFSQAMALDGTSSLPHEGLGKLYFTQGLYASAITHLRNAITHNEKSHNAHFFLAQSQWQDEQFEEAYDTFLRTLDLNPNDLDAHVSLAAMLATTGNLAHAGEQYQAWLAATRRVQEAAEPVPRALQYVPPNSIVFFCLFRPDDVHRRWGPSSISEGVGGSEEAVIYLSQSLADLGHSVVVYGRPPASDVGPDRHGVVWLPFYLYDSEACQASHFIVWRNPEFVHIGCRAAPVYLWMHDRILPDTIQLDTIETVRAVIVPTQSEAARVPVTVSRSVISLPNGLDSALFVDGENDHRRFIYASAPERGLVVLLQVWGTIRKYVEGAQLDVFYGFYPEAKYQEAAGQELRRTVEDLLQQDGVHFHGMVSQSALSVAHARAGFWLYPTSYPETSCITAMRAQAMGSIPITSRHVDSALDETAGVWDLGPPAEQGNIEESQTRMEAWVRAVLTAANQPPSQLLAHRESMKAWARQRFAWTSVAPQWATALNLPAPSSPY